MEVRVRTLRSLFRDTELDRTSWPALRDRILAYDRPAPGPRSYPGYPRAELPRARPRALVSLEKELQARRSAGSLSEATPSRAALGRVLQFSHGARDAAGHGPVPSAGGLQALELYLVSLAPGWLATGAYHYDRAGHHLSRMAEGADRGAWAERVPSMATIAGGSVLFIVVGDGARAEGKYPERAFRFLFLEAGHLMQNLCLMSRSVGLRTVPLGVFFEGEVSRELALPGSDAVLYAGLCGAPR
jgi:SagB-type dehydrogenase family enzyme